MTSLAAFLLCAGRGERLRPLTERIAKPALTFQGVSALEINRRKIEILRPEAWLANTHHLPEQVGGLAERLGLRVLHEPEILGTGGCLANAATILRRFDHFLVHNADLIHGLDLEALWAAHRASGALATLGGVHHPAHNTLCVAEDGRLEGVQGYQGYTAPAGSRRLTFSGVAFYRQAFLEFVSAGPEDIKKHWTTALRADARVQVTDCSGSAWHDFGSPQGLWEAAKFMMESSGQFSYNYPAAPGERPCVSNEAGQKNLPVGLRNALIYEKTEFPVESGVQNRIFGRNFVWTIPRKS